MSLAIPIARYNTHEINYCSYVTNANSMTASVNRYDGLARVCIQEFDAASNRTGLLLEELVLEYSSV